jgi:hypothetical protein
MSANDAHYDGAERGRLLLALRCSLRSTGSAAKYDPATAMPPAPMSAETRPGPHAHPAHPDLRDVSSFPA